MRSPLVVFPIEGIWIIVSKLVPVGVRYLSDHRIIGSMEQKASIYEKICSFHFCILADLHWRLRRLRTIFDAGDATKYLRALYSLNSPNSSSVKRKYFVHCSANKPGSEVGSKGRAGY